MELIHKIEYRWLTAEELTPGLLDHFDRYQEVRRVWRDVDGVLTLIENPFQENWGEKEKKALIKSYFPEMLANGGCVVAAYYKGEVIAFAGMDGRQFGSEGQYLCLKTLHVSYGYRELGIGTHLFRLCAEAARQRGAKKLYISGHSAEETQAFYKAMGCIPAAEVDAEQQLREPCDIQLEYGL